MRSEVFCPFGGGRNGGECEWILEGGLPRGPCIFVVFVVTPCLPAYFLVVFPSGCICAYLVFVHYRWSCWITLQLSRHSKSKSLLHPLICVFPYYTHVKLIELHLSNQSTIYLGAILLSFISFKDSKYISTSTHPVLVPIFLSSDDSNCSYLKHKKVKDLLLSR